MTLVDFQYLPDYEKLNSEPAQELISKFVAEVIIISHKAGISKTEIESSKQGRLGAVECIDN